MKTPYRRINLIGGPGSGKSTLAAGLFYAMRTSGFKNVEAVNEYIKEDAIAGRKPMGFDELYIFSKQIKAEDRCLRNNVPHIIAECPLLVCCAYAKQYGFSGYAAMLDLANHFEKEYPSVNLLLDRKQIPYVESGRYQSYPEAIEMDRTITEIVCENCDNSSIHLVSSRNVDKIMKIISENFSII